MNLLLQRYSDNGEATAGMLFLKADNKLLFLGHTLEDQHQDVKVKGETRIKAGFYPLVLQMAVTGMTEKYRAKFAWFKHFIMIDKVEGFTGVYIHHGTKEVDTDGCLLTADQAITNFDDDFKVLSHIMAGSTVNMERLYNLVVPAIEAGEKCFLEIRDEVKS